MNDLARPALYDAWHTIIRLPLRANPESWQIVGPICESGDFLGHDRELVLEPGDLLAILSAGAYGMTMSSNYNTARKRRSSGNQAHRTCRRELVRRTSYAPESRAALRTSFPRPDGCRALLGLLNT